MKKLKDLFIEALEKDTRDNSDLFVYRLKSQLDYKDFQKVSKMLKNNKIYYSRFKNGFISKTKIDFDILDLEVKETSTKQKSKRIIYNKLLTDYITIDEYKNYMLNDYLEENTNALNYYHKWTNSYDEAIEKYKRETAKHIDFMFNEDKRQKDYYNDLSYIREAIIWKSLGKDKHDFYCNGDNSRYTAIWDKLPIIEGLDFTNKAYTAIWGYDQTNVDIAYLLNKKFNGLYVLVYNKTVVFTRLKDNTFNDGVRYFTQDDNPEKTFQLDASITGHYH